MTTRTISTLKFVGSISLGLLTGVSYTLSTLSLPSLLTLPSATLASRTYTSLLTLTNTHVRSLTGLSSFAFLLAFYLSPRDQKHPYLLWTSLFAASSSFVQFLPYSFVNTLKGKAAPRRIVRERKEKDKKRMEASYEVLGESDREAGSSGEDGGDGFNGEEVREQMESEVVRQIVRTVVAGLGFAMSVVGIWGDGSVVNEVIFVELS